MDAFPTDPFEALVAILEGVQLPSLEAFIAANQEEGQHLEYKDGRLLEDPVKAKEEIREQVNGFGNSEGGLLVIGVTKTTPRKIAPCSSAPGGKPLKEWISGLLSPMAKDFSPPPRFELLAHSEGNTLVVAVPRAPHLFPIVENREARYYVRFGEVTIRMPPSHIADLLVGRRQVPRLELEMVLETAPSVQGEEVLVTVRSGVHNAGLVAAERVEGGILCWMVGPQQAGNRALHEHVDIDEPVQLDNLRDRVNPCHFRCGVYAPSRSESANARLAPFASLGFNEMHLRLPFAKFQAAPLEYTAAFYVLSNCATPSWFECHFSYPPLVAASPVQALTQPVYGRRPRVRLTRFGLS